MGKGINLKKYGTQVAFTAGTGILVFMDLVAYLIRKNLDFANKSGKEELDSSFKFVLYASFPSQQDSIGADLCEGL